jgi:hypothetical protein
VRIETALGPVQFAGWRATTLVPDDDIALYPAIERLDFDAVMPEMREAAELPDTLKACCGRADEARLQRKV